MKSLYRKYRPLKLEDVVGQAQVVKPLLSAIKQGKISHAYLLIGPRGCGKTSVARILAHEVNGFKYKVEDNYVDIIEIDGASNRKIEDVRELRDKIAIAPTKGKYKVYIIDEVHMLTREAFNALLKTLEEPPKHAIFIMATTDAHKVPVTITSRAQTYTFKLADEKTMTDYLKSVCEKEKIKITDDALQVIARRGGGSFRDSLSLLDQISTLSKDEITKEMVIKAMGLPQDEMIDTLLNEYINGDLASITSALRELLLSGVKPETLTSEIVARIIAEPKPELIPLLEKLSDVKDPYIEAKLLVALSARQSTTVLPGASAGHDRGMRGPSPVTTGARNPVPREDTLRLPTKQADSFDWDTFINKVQELNDAVYSQLKKCEHEFSDGELKLYPKRKIVQTILSKPNNVQVLQQAAGGVKITICDMGATPNDVEGDETLSKISAIMGKEVSNYGGTSPF